MNKEFYELMKQFESDIKRISVYVTLDFSKEEKESWKRGIIYSNGEINKLFKLYRAGYSYGKSTFQSETD